MRFSLCLPGGDRKRGWDGLGGRGLVGDRDPRRREALGWAVSVKDPEAWLSSSCSLSSLVSADKWRQSRTRCPVSPPLVAAAQRGGEPGAGVKMGDDASWLKNTKTWWWPKARRHYSPAGSALDLLSEEVISLTTCSQ